MLWSLSRKSSFVALLAFICCLPAYAQPARLQITSEQHRKHKWNHARYNFLLKNAAGQVVATYEDMLFLEPYPGTSFFIMGRGYDNKNFTYRNAEELGLVDAFTGKEVLACGKHQISLISRQLARIQLEGRKYQLYRANGTLLFPNLLEYVEGSVAGTFDRAWFCFKENGLYGLLDSTGAVRIAPRYHDPFSFTGKPVPVRLGDRWTLLGPDLKEVGPPRFAYISYDLGGVYAYSNTPGASLFSKSGSAKWGLIDGKGQILTGELYDDVTVASPFLRVKQNGQWLEIDPKALLAGKAVKAEAATPVVFREFHKQTQFGYYTYGYTIGTEVLVRAKYDMAYPFQGDYAIVGRKCKNKVMTFGGSEAKAMEYGLINRKGEEVIPTRYKSLWPYADGLYGFGVGGDWTSSYRYGIMNNEGKVLVPAEFQQLSELREGLIAARKDQLFGFMNLQGELVLPFAYKYASPFFDGIACVANADNSWYWIDKSGNELLPGKRFTSITDWDSTGKAWTWNKMDRWNRPDSALLIDRTGKVHARRPLNGPPAPPVANRQRCRRCNGSGQAYKAHDVNSSFTWTEGMFKPVETRTTYSYSYRVYEKDGACPQCGGDGYE